MERLTEHSKQTSHENGICCTHFRGPECLGVGGNCAMNCKWEEAAWSRLAACEDTGLTPEQCENAKTIIESVFSDDTSKAERILELLKADKDGRMVVLPCKVGDGLWTFCSYPVEQVYSFTVTDISTLNGRTMLNTSRCGVIDARDVGKTVFLTREEAEKELEAMKDA